jgi:hypothetical protein
MTMNALHQVPPLWLSVLAVVIVSSNAIIDPILFLWISPDNRRALNGLLSVAYCYLTCRPVVPLTKKAFDVSGSSRTHTHSRNTTVKDDGTDDISSPGASPVGSPVMTGRGSVIGRGSVMGSASTRDSEPAPVPLLPLPELALPASMVELAASSSSTMELSVERPSSLDASSACSETSTTPEEMSRSNKPLSEIVVTA